MRTVVRSAALIAFSVACGYAKLILFPYLFFVELFSVAVFLSGALSGVVWGIWIGAVARLLFSVGNPYGPPHPLVLAAQVVGGGAIGALGGLCGPWLLPPAGREGPGPKARTAILLGAGLAATLVYDLVTNVAQGIVFGSIPVTLAVAALPTLQHVASNVAIFAVLGNVAFPWLSRHPAVTRRAVMLAAACVLATGASPAAAQPPSDVPPGTTATNDSTLLVRVRAPDSTRVARAPVRETGLAAAPAVDFEEQRKAGDASLESALRGRRASLLMPLPLFGAATGALSVPDAGSRLRIFPLGTVADVATDRTLVAAKSYGIGVLDLATVLDNPRADGVETLDLTALSRGLKPEPFDRAGALLAEPAAERAFTRVVPGEGRRERRAKSALYYGNGDAGILDTGARFVSPALGKGIGGSYARHEADGISPLHHAVSTRYALAGGLPRLLRQDLWVEGEIFKWTVEDEADSVNPFTSAIETVLGRAEIASRSLTLHGRAVGQDRLSRWTLRAGEAKRTRVRPDGSRERWEFPEWSFRWNGELGPASGWTPVASLQADSRRVELVTEGDPLFAPRREEARAAAGLRRSLGRAGGAEGDLAVDWREASPTLLEGRLSTWVEGRRASGRIDLEWAHERPSWVDLLSPERVVSVPPPPPSYTKALRISRSGDPSLEPRLLAGTLARGSYALSRVFKIEAEGSMRKLVDDFGWDLSRLETVDTIFVDVRAGQRGDGWVSHGAISFVAQPGPLRLRGLGWARGGPDRLSPRAGSPPRYGADGAAAVRLSLFHGDLPVDLGFELHAQGPRQGIVREPAVAVLDGSIHADFGPAGAFFDFDNVLDRHVPSAIFDVASDRAVPMPGRSFRFGVVWYLFD